MDKLIQKLAAAKEEPGDYIGPDGLLYCGKCRTPKQKIQRIDLGDDGVKEIKAAVGCQCAQETYNAKQMQETSEQFRLNMRELWIDGISAPNGLRYRFADDDRKNAKISDICRRYVDQWEDMKKDAIGMVFYGSVGTGKTFFTSCIGNGLLDKLVPVASTNFPRLLNLLQGTNEKQKLLDRLALYKLLIIDDLGVERDSSFAAEQVFNVIDARVSSGLPVIVTTNLTLEELQNPGSMQYMRIYDRLLERCPVRIKMTGDSRRTGNAERRKEVARKLLLD